MLHLIHKLRYLIVMLALLVAELLLLQQDFILLLPLLLLLLQAGSLLFHMLEFRDPQFHLLLLFADLMLFVPPEQELSFDALQLLQ